MFLSLLVDFAYACTAVLSACSERQKRTRENVKHEGKDQPRDDCSPHGVERIFHGCGPFRAVIVEQITKGFSLRQILNDCKRIYLST